MARRLGAAICDSWRRWDRCTLADPLFRCFSRRGRAREQPPQQETPAPGLGMSSYGSEHHLVMRTYRCAFHRSTPLQHTTLSIKHDIAEMKP